MNVGVSISEIMKHTISVASTLVPTIFNRTSSSFAMRMDSSSETKAGGLLCGSKFISWGINYKETETMLLLLFVKRIGES